MPNSNFSDISLKLKLFYFDNFSSRDFDATLFVELNDSFDSLGDHFGSQNNHIMFDFRFRANDESCDKTSSTFTRF